MRSSPVPIWNFLLVEPRGLMLSLAVGDTTCSTSFQINALARVLFGYLQSLQEVWSFRAHFGSQVVFPPRRRWDLCHEKLHQLWGKPLREQFIFQRFWRCAAHRDVQQLKIVWGSCFCPALSTEVASMFRAMQSLWMPWRASANVTGLVFYQVKVSANEMGSKHIDMIFFRNSWMLWDLCTI